MGKAEFRALLARADAAGREAAKATTHQMITVRDATTGKVYEPFPICGFGWVTLTPGTSSLARYAKANDGWRKHWHRGVYKWSPLHTQSYDENMEWARAYAAVLKDAGFDAYADGRLD